MTNEQREAIELAKEFTKMDFSNPMGWTGYYDAELKELSQAIDTVLSLIKEQEEKIGTTTTNYKNLIADVSMLAKNLGLEEDATIDEIYIAIKTLRNKDKQIDLMAEEIIMTKPANCTRTNEFNTEKVYMSKEEIKQYFAELVEKE